MIYTNVTVKINNNGTATSNNKVVLYRGDREVEIQMTLAGNPFIVESSTYAQLIIRRNDAAPIITGIAPLRDSKVILTITEANIDELTEVGSYAYQIRLYDDDMSARVTLPPVENGLEVREPIVDEASGVIGRAMVGYSLISRAFDLRDDNATFNEFDEYNRTNWVDGDFITDVKMNKIEDALYTINQRVLSNAVSAYVSSNTSPDQKVGIGESLDITFEFTSPNLGRGTVKVLVDGVQKISMYVDQEVETTVTVTEDMLKKGENRVTLHVVDRAGKMSNELLFMVRYGSTEITSDFDAYTAYQYGASVRYYFIPTSLDSSMALTFYMRIDGAVSEGMPCTSDVRGYFTFPNNLAIGDHFCEAYIVDAEGNQSNVLEFTFVVIDSFSIVVASDTRNPVIEEGAQLSLDYRVYMQYGDTFITKTYVDGDLVNTGQCGLETAYYRTSSLTEGIHTIRVEVFDTSETVTDYIIWTVTVTESTFEALTPASSGGIFLASALNHSNSDATKNVWIGVDQDGNKIEAPLQGFAFNNESGWIDDELVFNGNSSVIVPITPLANNARYGFTLDIEFTSKAVGEEDAMVLNLWDNTKNCGIRITTEQLILRSAEGNECMLYFEDNTNTSVMFIIDRNEAKAKIYLNGVMCSAFHLSDYEAGGQYFLEDFAVSGNLQLGGKGYCKIRNLRVYEVALTTTEILNNFISNKVDKNEQKDLIKFQNGDNLPTLTVYCDFSGLGKDDKKPCKIVYTSTDEEKYGKSFTLDHKQSQLQYQGTSSMAYPIKNYRLNLRDENGDKLYYDFPFGKPECRFTLKADFMSSGHWQNTGLTKWINDNLYHYNENDESSMNPKKWFDLQNGGSLDDTRECIYGFPCRLILVNDGNTPLNEGQNEPTPGNTKDMGIFNFNNDKDNTDTMGFDQDNFPNCMGFEVTANSDTSAGAFMSYKERFVWYDPKSDRSSDIPLEEFGLKPGDTIRVISEAATPDGGVGLKFPHGSYIMTYPTVYRETVIPDNETHLRLHFNGGNWYEINGIRYVKTTDIALGKAIYSQDAELEYLQQSFEMRYPDPDDYDEWHGYLGINAGTMVTDYIPIEDGYSTTYWYWDQTNMTISSSTVVKTVECYYNDKLLAAIAFNKDYGSVTLIDGSNKLRLIFEDVPEEFYIGDTKYIFGNEIAELIEQDPYLGEEISPNYGLKRVIDWVDNCSDAEFVKYFDNYFHRDYTLRYYLLVITLGMVDNLGKNMMFDSWDGQIWMPRFYDCDTICSYDNSGDIKFDVDIEMEQGYWNTSSSRLWTRIRDLMHDELVIKYNDMRQNGLSYDSLMRYFYDEQIAKIPQKYYNQDYDVKYAPFAESYMGMAHGDGYEHLKRWLKKRLIFTDTLFDYAPSYNNDVLTIRANTTQPMTISIETYTPVYQHVSWYNGQMDKQKIDGKIAVSFTGTAMAATDQEVLIYGGSNIKRISGLSSMNPNQMLIGSATRLVELDAPNCPLLADINSNKANLSPHVYLNKVNLSNCPLLGGNLLINNSPLIKDINIKGTAITGLILPSSIRNLQILRLPNGIPTLALHDAAMLHTLEFDPGANLQRVSMSNCNALTNVVNLDLLNTPSVSLNNSYNTAAELYFRDATDLSLSNMPNLERVIFTPNNEYETFELINVANAPDYKVTTFNCPKLSTFMTTAPYRESFNNVSGYVDKEIGVVILAENYSPKGASFAYDNIFIDFENGGYIEAKVDLSRCINNLENIISFGLSIADWSVSTKQIHMHYDMQSANMCAYDAANDINNKSINIPVTKIVVIRLDASGAYINGTKCCENSLIGLSSISIGSQEGTVRSNAIYNYIKYYGDHSAIIQVKDYDGIKPNTTFTANSIDISSTQFTDVKLLCTTDTNTLKLPTTVKNFYCDSSFDLDTDYLEDGEYDVVHGELVEQYTTDYEGEVVLKNVIIDELNETDPRWIQSEIDGNGVPMSGNEIEFITDFISVVPSTTFKIQAKGTLYRCRLYEYDIDKTYIGLASSQENQADKSYTFTLSKNTRYVRPNCQRATSISRGYKFFYEELRTPNLTPSSADGSLIFSMYAPSNTVAPASGTWDLKGLEFDNFHTFGMNNDVRGEYEVQNIPNFEGIVFTSNCFKGTRDTSTYAGYFQMGWLNLNNATVITSDGSSIGVYVPGSTYGYSSPATNVTEPCVALSFYPTVEWVKIIENGIEYHFEKSSLELGTKNVSLSDKTAITLSVSSIVTGSLQSITMPSRYDDYNISIRNAYIAPREYNTMLYPLLVNEDNPITGTLDYTNYAGKHLSWSFAYTDEDYVNIIQPKGELLNSYEYRYNAFYQTDYEFDNPYEIARYISSASGVLPSFNKEFTYTYDEMDNGDGTYTTKIYTDSLDNLPKSINFIAKPIISVDKLNTSQATSLQGLFQSCNKLERVDTRYWDTSKVTTMKQAFFAAQSLTSLDLSNLDTSSVKDMASMFHDCKALITLDVSNFDTSNVTDMGAMFQNCNSLTSLNISEFDTSKVTNMYGMFYDCSGLTSLDLSGFDTKNVTNMDYMLYRCSGLTSLDLSGFNTGKVTNMKSMFSGCSGLTSLDLSNFDTGNVTNMGEMFHACSGLTSLDLSGFDTGNVTNMSNMFNGCSSLTSLDLSSFDTVNVTDMNSMFQSCTNLTTLDVSGFDTKNVINMASMFRYCNSIRTLSLDNFDTSKVTDMSYMFQSNPQLEALDLSAWNVDKVTNFREFITLCGKLISLNLSNWSLDNVNTIIPQLRVNSLMTSTLYGGVVIDESTLPSGWVYKFNNILEIARYTANASGVVPTFNNGFTGYNVNEIDNNNNTYTVSIMTDSLDNLPTSISFSDKTGLLTVDKLNTKNVTNMYNMFYSCYNLTSLDLSGFDTSKVTDMSNMFYNCSKLTSLDLSNFDTSKVTNMASMFRNCRGLTSLDLSNFDTSEVTDMSNMFYNCINLTSLDLSDFKASNVVNMNSMFYGCSKLTSLNLSNFNTSNVTNMNSMFYGCSKLTSLDLTGFDTSKVTNMSEMFRNCSSLTSLDVSGFKTSNVTLMGSMFRTCTSLTSLDLSGLDASKVTDMGSMFYYCINLTSLDLSDFKASNVVTTYAMFQDCSKLTSLDLSGFDTSKATNMSSMFKGCSGLTLLDSMKNISLSLDLFATILDATSLLDVIDNLATVSTKQTLTLGSTLLDKLTEDQIAIAVNKGWTVA